MPIKWFSYLKQTIVEEKRSTIKRIILKIKKIKFLCLKCLLQPDRNKFNSLTFELKKRIFYFIIKSTIWKTNHTFRCIRNSWWLLFWKFFQKSCYILKNQKKMKFSIMTVPMLKGFWISATAPCSGSGNRIKFLISGSAGKYFIESRFLLLPSENEGIFFSCIYL